jgi:hypothetical protein
MLLEPEFDKLMELTVKQEIDSLALELLQYKVSFSFIVHDTSGDVLNKLQLILPTVG